MDLPVIWDRRLPEAWQKVITGCCPEVSLALTVFAEVICSVLILVGFGTRLASVPLIITMLVVVLYIHGSDPFAKQEPGIHFLVGYVVLLITGSGRFSLDQRIVNNQPSITYAIK